MKDSTQISHFIKRKKKAECINSSWETRTKNQLQRGRGYSRLTIVVSMIHSDVRF